MELFENEDVTISLTVFPSNTNPKWPVAVALSKFFRVVRTEKYLMRFQSQNTVFGSLWRSDLTALTKDNNMNSL